MHEELVDKKLTWDHRVLVVMLVCAVSLSLQEFIGDRGYFQRLDFLPWGIRHGKQWGELWTYVWWAAWRVLGYLIIPSIVILFWKGERIRDYGWSLRGFVRHIRLYIALYVGVLPLVWLFSLTADFKRIYPFYRLANRSTADFVIWELLYAAQFLSLEFFFRGFMLWAVRRSLGVYAIFVMVVPYNMIHFGKTLPESLGAIFAGIILGTIALRTRSIWGGVFVHVAVALTMDFLTIGYLRPR